MEVMSEKIRYQEVLEPQQVKSTGPGENRQVDSGATESDLQALRDDKDDLRRLLVRLSEQVCIANSCKIS